jgi:hypothetical protein
MPVLDNSRHERFAQFLSQGKTMDEAYQLAGFKPDKGNPSHLMARTHVRERVQELTGALARKTQITAESLAEMAKKVHDRAMETNQLSAANTAIKELGVLSGQRIERSEIGGPGEFDHLTDEELERELIERFVALGLDRHLKT